MLRKFHLFLALVLGLVASACHTPTQSALSIPAPPHSGLTLPKVFSDNMVLQQVMSVPIWGWGDDGDKVTVTFRGQKASAKVKDGKWQVQLFNLKPGGPDVLTVTEKSSIQLTNVLVGEVWLASGQSNMEFPLKRSFQSEADIAASANPMIRFFHVPKLKLNSPTNDVAATWTACDSNTSPSMTAVGYYFVRDLQKAHGVPVGLIQSDWGGSPAEAWTREEILSANPRYRKEILTAYTNASQNYTRALAAYQSEKAQAKEKKQPFDKVAPRAPWKPSELYNGMIAPVIPFAIKGAIWYQGESNAGRAHQYRSLFVDMISNWRADWAEGDFTFLAVQLAPFKAIKLEPAESDWAELREAQYLATKKLPKVGMAVITDVGEEKDIHPTKKQPVGARLALAARGIAYGEKIEYSGPIYRSMSIQGDKVTLTFDHVGTGLQSHDGPLKGFAICGEDKQFLWAPAEIVGLDKVVVSSPAVQNPIAVRYGWADYPVVNLWNKEGLPASPFRTDDFPMVTAPKQ